MNLESLQEKIKFFAASLNSKIHEIEENLLLHQASFAEERFKQIESETTQDILEKFEYIFGKILFGSENEI